MCCFFGVLVVTELVRFGVSAVIVVFSEPLCSSLCDFTEDSFSPPSFELLA